MRTRSFFALFCAVALVAAGVAWAGDDVPADKPATATSEAPAAKAPETATESPIHTMLKWVGSHVMDGDCACPSTEKGEKAWRTWFTKTDGPLAGLRTAMMQDGWNADRTIGFFKAMAAQKSSAKGECGSCDKSKGAAAPTGDAGTTGDAQSPCGCDKSKCKDGGGCDKSKCKGGGCDKSKGAAAPTGDAGTTGDAQAPGGCDKSKCKDGGCDKSKCKDGGCDKSKGAAAPTGDAGTTGDAAPKCPCTGKPQSDCSGCGKDTCPCGKAKGAAAPTQSAKSDKSDK